MNKIGHYVINQGEKGSADHGDIVWILRRLNDVPYQEISGFLIEKYCIEPRRFTVKDQDEIISRYEIKALRYSHATVIEVYEEVINKERNDLFLFYARLTS